jgi:hypothetical protein
MYVKVTCVQKRVCSEVPWTRVLLVRPFAFDDAGQVTKFGRRIASGNDWKLYLSGSIYDIDRHFSHKPVPTQHGAETLPLAGRMPVKSERMVQL